MNNVKEGCVPVCVRECFMVLRLTLWQIVCLHWLALIIAIKFCHLVLLIFESSAQHFCIMITLVCCPDPQLSQNVQTACRIKSQGGKYIIMQQKDGDVKKQSEVFFKIICVLNQLGAHLMWL